MSCENDESSTSETFNTIDEYIEDLNKRLKNTKPTYKPLTKDEQELYLKTKVIVDNRKATTKTIVQAYIIYAIRNKEESEYIEEIATTYKQDLKTLTEL